MTDEQIQKLVADYLTQTLRASEDARVDGRDPNIGDLDTQLASAREDLAEGDHRKLANVADVVLEAAGVSIAKGSDEYNKLCRELLKGIVEVVMPTEIERAKGNYGNKYDRLGSYLSRLSPAAPAPTAAAHAPASAPAGELLSKLIPECMDDRATGGRWRGRTRDEAEGIFGLFLRVAGDRDIRTLDRRTLTEFRDILIHFPTHANKKPQYTGKTIAEILKTAAIRGDQLLSTPSVNKHLVYIQAFLKWAVSNGYAATNFAEGLSISTRNVSEDSEHEVYDKEDLLRLVKSLPPAGSQPEHYWIPIIGLYSGMRLNEIAQLFLEDIKAVDGIPCFDINNAGDKRLKNAVSKRVIPIHPMLLELGFMNYVERLREKRAVRLWPNLKDKRSGFSQDVGRWYQRFNRKHITMNPKRTFHSFRHTLLNELKQLQVSVAGSKGIAGHSQGSITHDRYGKGYEPGVLLDALRKVKYGIEDELRKPRPAT